MAFDPQATADLVERVIKTALTPIMVRVRALEAQASPSRAVPPSTRQRACVEKALTELRVCTDEHLMMLAAGLSADGADESMVNAVLLWARRRAQTVTDDYRRDVTVQLTVAAWTPSTPTPTPAE